MSWGKWGSTPAAEVELDLPPDGVLSAKRYCPRCDDETLWTNEAAGDTTLACIGCGITVASQLEPHELDRVDAYDAKPIRMARRGYQVI